ncbi:hypothetical protein ASPVEDRAFT_655736 [Aspergillus versicolor CBS 583.65]|uniref:Uncharacterized protein n=1 Tax=Aspergillus versicolor CBS 583.65 TaxID=1036611 RepID=A0A1L9PKS7_ASPVE|nr:uncharacterized protein ASPVEDRAFT_655736 [Aspergillus versicolor CBS 583.65]OJJ02093.1 hypothetical protein ASPVEDRAFT_655736 [Aspergillus versicolor CBS 583.65]
MRPSSRARGSKDRNVRGDLESGQQPALPPTGAPFHPRRQLIAEMFGLENEDECEGYTGVREFCDHLETNYFPRFASFDKEIWKLLRYGYPTDAKAKWWWCLKVVEACRCLQNGTEGSNPTARALAAKFLSKNCRNDNMELHNVKAPIQIALAKALIHTLCWLSAVISPVMEDDEEEDSLHVSSDDPKLILFGISAEYNGKKTIITIDLRHTLSEIFHKIHQAAVPTPKKELGIDADRSMHETGDVLYESAMNYASLKKYGGIRLRWVDTLSEHLSLDRGKRELSLFRFPSLCALRVLKADRLLAVANITNRLLAGRDYALPYEVDDDERVCEQVILSYRLLFGQNSKSRDLLRSQLMDGQRSRGGVDSFILQCIGAVPGPWRVRLGRAKPDKPFSSAILPEPHRRDDGYIKEWKTYFAMVNFSSFRWRLLALQTFGNDHPPTDFLDYVMDPRAPMQRAAARVGVLAVVLAILFGTGQISLSGRQLVEARS